MTWVSRARDGRGSTRVVTEAASAARLAKGTLEAGQRAHDGVALHGERDADVARHAEAGAGHGEHALVGQQAHEGHVVVDGRAREHVEGALRLHAPVADARQPLVHQVALLAIRRDVDHLVADLRHHPLPQRRRVHEAEHAARERAGLEQRGRLRHARRERQIADALAGNGQRLGPGGGDDRAGDQRRHLGHDHVVEHERAVRLVADQHDRPRRARQQRLDLDEGRGGIDHAARIVRRVHEDRARPGRDGRLEPGDVWREIGPRRYHDQPPAVVLGVERVLREEWRHREHLVAGVEQRLQHGVERGAGADGHEHVVGRVRQSGGAAQPRGHRLADARMASIGHVGVQVARVAVQHAPCRGQHRRRRFDLRVAEREVEDLVGAAFGLEARALLEHAANPRRLLEIVGDGPGDDHALGSSSVQRWSGLYYGAPGKECVMKPVPEIYRRLGVRPIIHASGTTTRYGGSILRVEALEAMREASTTLVNMDELNEAAGAAIARMLGAEAAFVTAGASSGLILQAAACIAGADPAKITRLPDTRGMRNEIIIQRAHRFAYDQAYRVAGGVLVEIGLARRTQPFELEEAITERTAAVAYLVSPFTSPPGILSLEDVLAIAHKRGVPVIVDAASMLPPRENLTKFVRLGADLVSFSGGKGIRGPQSTGILAGRKDLVRARALNASPNQALGRPAKTSKEALADIPGLRVVVEQDAANRVIPHAVVYFTPDWVGPSGHAVQVALAQGAPHIYVQQGAHQGGYVDEIAVDPINLQPGDEAIVAARLREELTRVSRAS